MKGSENARDAPPIRTRNSRALFFVWKGIFCQCKCMYTEKGKNFKILINAHHIDPFFFFFFFFFQTTSARYTYISRCIFDFSS